MVKLICLPDFGLQVIIIITISLLLPYHHYNHHYNHHYHHFNIDNNIDTSDSAKIDALFKLVDNATKQRYIRMNCHVAFLLIDIYRNYTDFHEEYMVRYLNKFKDPTFNHEFTR